MDELMIMIFRSIKYLFAAILKSRLKTIFSKEKKIFYNYQHKRKYYLIEIERWDKDE